ncbi:MAG: hypothetical protein IEMM0008_0447 [bacterium]|nr:MAG: hypothetical protein IEMM0008_0447 [bacterium]
MTTKIVTFILIIVLTAIFIYHVAGELKGIQEEVLESIPLESKKVR